MAKDRRVIISVPQSVLLEAGANGCTSIEDYITFLKKQLDKKQMQYEAIRGTKNEGIA